MVNSCFQPDVSTASAVVLCVDLVSDYDEFTGFVVGCVWTCSLCFVWQSLGQSCGRYISIMQNVKMFSSKTFRGIIKMGAKYPKSKVYVNKATEQQDQSQVKFLSEVAHNTDIEDKNNNWWCVGEVIRNINKQGRTTAIHKIISILWDQNILKQNKYI